jgi:hypothetical protein
MSRLSKIRASLTSEPFGWHARLYRHWMLYNALAFTIILGTVYLLAGVGLDVTKQAAGHIVASLLIALAGGLFYGVVLGSLQWRVLRQRIPIPRRPWIISCVGPGTLAWLLVVLPDVLHTAASGGTVQVAFLTAVSQALALGPLLGLSQARALRPYTTRWAWWIVANIGSWLIVDGVIYMLSLAFSSLDYVSGNGSSAEIYVMLLLTTPLTGRMMLWVTARPALIQPQASVTVAGGTVAPGQGPSPAT